MLKRPNHSDIPKVKLTLTTLREALQPTLERDSGQQAGGIQRISGSGDLMAL